MPVQEFSVHGDFFNVLFDAIPPSGKDIHGKASYRLDEQNNLTRVRVVPGLSDQGCRKNDEFILLAHVTMINTYLAVHK